jgi:hypothetical protein
VEFRLAVWGCRVSVTGVACLETLSLEEVLEVAAVMEHVKIRGRFSIRVDV